MEQDLAADGGLLRRAMMPLGHHLHQLVEDLLVDIDRQMGRQTHLADVSAHLVPRFAQGGVVVQNPGSPQVAVGKGQIEDRNAGGADRSRLSLPDEVSDDRKTPERHFPPLGRI